MLEKNIRSLALILSIRPLDALVMTLMDSVGMARLAAARPATLESKNMVACSCVVASHLRA